MPRHKKAAGAPKVEPPSPPEPKKKRRRTSPAKQAHLMELVRHAQALRARHKDWSWQDAMRAAALKC